MKRLLPTVHGDRHRLSIDIFLVVILWLILSKLSLANHVSNDGLPHPTGSGKTPLKAIDWRLYAQGRYTLMTGSDERFALRRLKFSLGGHPTNYAEYYAQAIFKEGNDSVTDDQPFLQEAWLAYDASPFLRLMAGQFKPPFGMERFTSDARIYTINRSQATDHLVPNGRLGNSFTRDYGVQIDGWHRSDRFYYAIGIFEGEGANNGIQKPSPLLSTRLVYRLYDDEAVGGQNLNLHVGGAFAIRWADALDLSGCCPGAGPALGTFTGRDRRWTVELAADWGETSLRAEYFRGTLDFSGTGNADITTNGWYVQGAQFLGRYLQAVIKFEGFDPDESVSNRNDLFWTTLGINFYIDGDRIKAMLNYVFKQEPGSSPNNDALLVQFQYFFK